MIPEARAVSTAITALAVLICSGCASPTTNTSTSGAWLQSQGGPYDRVLVVGLADDFDVRRAFEKAMVDSIEQGESRAVSSYVRGRELGLRELTRDNVVALAEKANADAVVVSRVVGREGKAGKSQEETIVHVGPTVRVTQNEEKTMTAVVASNYAVEVVPGTDVVEAHAVLETTVYALEVGEDPVYEATIDAEFVLGAGDRVEIAATERAAEIAGQLRDDGVIR